MILADIDLRQRILNDLIISPYDESCIQPSSYDLHLMGEVLVFDNYQASEIDVRQKIDVTRGVKIEKEGFVLHPGEFMLGSTEELFKIPLDLAGKLEGKSSLGRLGLLIHATAGFVDPGFEGQLTFEITNVSRLPIRIYGGMKIAQICFLTMSRKVEIAYGDKRLGSKYKGQSGPTASLGYLNFKKDES